MITNNLSTLKIHKLTQEQYDREFTNGNIDETALYLTVTPDEDIPVTSVNGATGAVTVNEVPDCTTSDNDKFLCVVNGIATWVAIPNAEEATF